MGMVVEMREKCSFGETYPVEVAGVGYRPLYDPQNKKPRS